MRQMDGSGPMPMVSNGMPGGLMAVPAHLYSPGTLQLCADQDDSTVCTSHAVYKYSSAGC